MSADVAEEKIFGRLLESLDRVVRDVSRTQSSLRSLRVFNEALSVDGQGGQIVAIVDPDAVDTRIAEAAGECKFEVLVVQPGGSRPRAILEKAYPRDSAMLKRGVSMRTIYQHSARFCGNTQNHVESLTAIGAEVRTLDCLSRRLMIFDRHTAFISGDSEDAGVIMIKHAAVVAFLVDVFEGIWNFSQPMTSSYRTRVEGSVVSEIQNSIMKLMMTEEKDGAIARRLAISERTCRSHISKIMRRLGARNRTHLGYLIAREEGARRGREMYPDPAVDHGWGAHHGHCRPAGGLPPDRAQVA
ncbi:helix-turn-helix transcriptional regulator [Streptomyces sp. NBC_01387]|uniref:helix-turn-helix transcriptional regulator n=1 Tax=unclassified Streptomyces TaxID=2593676 RepID=UPI002024803B|nr:MULTISPECIES: helix-turn-helix transcriptional regulator [unclassified Streptomyces]MCX4551213.1 helix-turn-helix transcriptional regulator [Streptomyces sp. NBC_01500]WSC22609.1 helix-turn-helix transcriptional regulator [Streptomyces sp. NBC_01766]WSV56452.1 helix-turn-helix transcriptional regulator [Streptomyces sp. NBC_01014]